ncbi:MAG TPA: RNA polymerase sigma factor RpoD/SigA [Fibrobacteria bacterium]|nr:RNA polymerase sigma factor RpoD/SigA [Fibrobacteria bacterium]
MEPKETESMVVETEPAAPPAARKTLKPEPDRPIRFVGDENGLTLYLREISRTRNLSLDEEASLAIRIRQGDRRALNKLITANLKFVVSVCRNYQNQGLPLTDLINEGNLGLIRAAKRFDETKHFKFISYAVWWIRQAILQALAEQSRIINIPLNRVSAIHRIGKAGVRLEQQLGRSVSPLELSGHLDLQEAEISECVQLSTNPVSLEAPLQAEEEGRLGDVLKDENGEEPDLPVLRDSLRDEVRKVLGTLAQREEEVVRLYFGIGVDTGYTLEEIGVRFNLTRERVRQIKEKALKRLKHSSRSRRLVPFRA